MKKLDLAQTLGILANVGVIAGMVSSNLDLASAIAKVRAGETLSPSEEVLIYSFYIRRFRGMEAYFVEFQAGS